MPVAKGQLSSRSSISDSAGRVSLALPVPLDHQGTLICDFTLPATTTRPNGGPCVFAGRSMVLVAGTRIASAAFTGLTNCALP